MNNPNFYSTDTHCANGLNGEHDIKHNSIETHFVCCRCSRLLGEIPEDKKNPIPKWRKDAQNEYK